MGVEVSRSRLSEAGTGVVKKKRHRDGDAGLEIAC